MTAQEFAQLFDGLKTCTKVAVVCIDEPLPAGVSPDDATMTLAQGDRYVVWGDRQVPHLQGNVIHLGSFTRLHVIERDRAAELMSAGATWSGTAADSPTAKRS